jgi:hypothetical protein
MTDQTQGEPSHRDPERQEEGSDEHMDVDRGSAEMMDVDDTEETLERGKRQRKKRTIHEISYTTGPETRSKKKATPTKIMPYDIHQYREEGIRIDPAKGNVHWRVIFKGYTTESLAEVVVDNQIVAEPSTMCALSTIMARSEYDWLCMILFLNWNEPDVEMMKRMYLQVTSFNLCMY